MAAIAALMQERARFESWLSTLETRRSATPTHVFDRVRGDYSRRLQHVLDQIASRASDLRQTRDALTGRLSSLQSDETARRDERAEAELRAAVGEFTDEQWQEVSERSDGEISRLVSQRQEVTGELGRLEEILAIAEAHRPSSQPSRAPSGEAQRPSVEIAEITAREAAPPAAAAAPSPPTPQPPAPSADELSASSFDSFVAGMQGMGQTPAAGIPAADSAARSPGLADMPDAPAVFAPEPAAQPAARGPLADVGSAAPSEDFDELAFLKSVVEPARNEPGARPADGNAAAGGAGPASARPGGAPAPSPAGATADGGSGFDLGIGESDVRMSASSLRGFGEEEAGAALSRGPGAVPTGGPLKRTTSPSLHRMATPDASSAGVGASPSQPKEEAPRRPTYDSMPSILRGMQPQQEKTLKCQECGTMNYPTEWYCEKCGGELAAM
ncbi:MAG TPA: hypothetical protein VKA84_12590 [Gemmatimonadaceae bacterium]|nr:hypothetical protein [Gemmatimonadaceae bacterium]